MSKPEELKIFVSCAKGMQYILEQEVQELGAKETHAIPGGVYCVVEASGCYQILLWSRIASRVIVLLAEAKVDSPEDVYEVAKGVDWTEHFLVGKSFAVHFLGTNTFIRNSTFGALKVKDGIADSFREALGQRPDIDRKDAQVNITARLAKGRLSLGIDLSGQSLHKRHYRVDAGDAPLKENLAAAILRLAGWPERFDADAGLIDPMCGSGTFLIEAAQLATDYAPGMRRQEWGFSHWLRHDAELWSDIVHVAKARHEKARETYRGRIVGFDQDSGVVKKAWENVMQSGFQDWIHVEKRPLSQFVRFEGSQDGLLVVNPPYGERLGEVESLGSLYQDLGRVFESFLLNWKAAVFTGNAELGRQLGWRSHKQYQLYNGALESQLLLFDLVEKNRFRSAWQSPEQKLQNPELWKISHASRADMFRNRLLKNRKNIAKWASKQGISCYRLYDADMPEFSLAIDCYRETSGCEWAHVQEYAAPSKVDEKAAAERLSESLAVIRDTLGVKPENIVLKSRMAQKGRQQYEKNADSREFHEVQEGSARFLVNFFDYLDTGLFLDHRPVRRLLFEQAKGKSLLNLFCYTASVSVQAALGSAARSLSLDMSKTYLNWAQQNYDLNGLRKEAHRLQRADCVEWLKAPDTDERFDIIFLDPPSFSNSKNMEGVLDVQRDHEAMIDQAMKLLSDNGELVFSNNLRKFKLSEQIPDKYAVTDWLKQSLDKDFERNRRIHHCWRIAKR